MVDRAGSALWEVDKMGLLLILLSYYALNSIFSVENGDGSATTQILYFSHYYKYLSANM